MDTKHKFDPREELRDVGIYPAVPGIYGMPSFPSRKFNTPITPKENVLRMCRKEMPLWIPNVSVDFNSIQPEVMPDAAARSHGGIDWFGIEWQYEALSMAAMVKPGTRRLSSVTKWKEELIWPDLGAIDWEEDYRKNYARAVSPERATQFIIVNGLLERLADLTSFADTFMYLIEEPEAVGDFFDQLTDFHIELMEIAKSCYKADIITFHDDMGTQISSFMSPDMFSEIMVPHYKRMNKAAHGMGLYVNFHSCGNVTGLIEHYIDAGFDFWEGQDACCDKPMLMEKYGDRLGQFSVFMPPPELSDEKFAEAIETQINSIGRTGRYITWFADMNPNRRIDGTELLYSMTRALYCG